LLAQFSAAQQLSDQNTLQMAAAYMLGVSYNERGYMGARVQVTQQDGKDVFTVNPGPLYHFKSVTVTGLPENAMTVVMQDAPKAGDVFSAARVNDWLIEAKKRLQVRGQNLKVRQEGHLDHASASVTVMIAFQE
jgi:outer membrane protein assembly factor BamA